MATDQVYNKTETDSLLSAKADESGLATVATSGAYSDLTGKPTTMTPTDGSVTDAKVASGAAISADKTADGTTNKAYTAVEKTKLAAVTGTNTGDETTATIKSKLSITTLSGSNTGDQTSVSGNAGTATALATPRAINGVPFDGTAPITVVDSAAVPKSLGTTKGDLVGFSAAGTPVHIPVAADGAFLASDSTAAAGVSYQQALTASSLTLGSTNGTLKKPWGESPYIGPELWSTTYFCADTVNSIAGNTSTTTPSVTGNSTNHSVMTRFRTGYTTVDGQVQETYRFDYTLTNTASNAGWLWLAIRGLTTGGATVSGTEIFLFTTQDGLATNYRSSIDFTVPAIGTGSGVRWIEVQLGAANNSTSGSLSLSNCSFRMISSPLAPRPGLNVSWATASGPSGISGSLNCDVPVVDPITQRVNWCRRTFGPDGQLQVSPTALAYYSGTYQFNYMVPSTGSAAQQACKTTISGGTPRNLHINNSAVQIMGVVNADASLVLRCNTHGGEWGRRVRTITTGSTTSGSNILQDTAAGFTTNDIGAAISGAGIPQGSIIGAFTDSSHVTMVTVGLSASNATATASNVSVGIGNYATNFVFEMDFGDGTWHTLTDGNLTHQCRRLRITCHTEVVRTDQNTPFANVDNTLTIFDDGTMRIDRTITFLATQQMGLWIYYMHTFDNSTPVLEPARMGYGQQVITGWDPRQYLTTPVAATAANGSSGGTYGALTRTYFTTAGTPQGETLISPSVASTTSTGTTNTFTVTQPATQTGQTWWAVYDSTGRISPRLPVAQTTWVDTGPTYGTVPAPTISTATVLPGTQQYMRSMDYRSDWTAFFDQDVSNIVLGFITDRDNALSYPGAVALTSETESHPGVLKNYWELHDGTGWLPVAAAGPSQGGYQQNISSGTVLSTTAYSFTYAPLDRANWHREIANRGQGFKQFNTVYPST